MFVQSQWQSNPSGSMCFMMCNVAFIGFGNASIEAQTIFWLVVLPQSSRSAIKLPSKAICLVVTQPASYVLLTIEQTLGFVTALPSDS